MSAPKHGVVSIVLNRGDGTFTPGEILEGALEVKLDKPQKVIGVKLLIEGKSITGWQGRLPKEHDPNESDTVWFHGDEKHFTAERYVYGGASNPPVELPSKRLVIAFSVPLPKELPSTIEHKLGSVRHTITAVVERPYLTDIETETDFRIISQYDLNERPQARIGIRESVQKSFCYFCLCPWGKMHVTISLPCTGFAIGQVIPVTVHCENESCVNVSKIRLRLYQSLTFFTTRPERQRSDDRIKVAEKKSHNPFTTTSEDHVTVELIVPSLPPSTLEYCGIINLDYSLRVEVCFSGMHCSIARTFPVLIGTVPLRGLSSADQTSTTSLPQPSAPLQEQPSSSQMPFGDVSQPGPSFPPAPPTYEETMKTDDHSDWTRFASQYPSKNYGSIN